MSPSSPSSDQDGRRRSPRSSPKGSIEPTQLDSVDVYQGSLLENTDDWLDPALNVQDGIVGLPENTDDWLGPALTAQNEIDEFLQQEPQIPLPSNSNEQPTESAYPSTVGPSDVLVNPSQPRLFSIPGMEQTQFSTVGFQPNLQHQQGINRGYEIFGDPFGAQVAPYPEAEMNWGNSMNGLSGLPGNAYYQSAYPDPALSVQPLAPYHSDPQIHPSQFPGALMNYPNQSVQIGNEQFDLSNIDPAFAEQPTGRGKKYSRGSSSSGSREAPNTTAATIRYKAERPKRDNEHAWVRTNESTQGKNTRSGKINQYDPKLVYKAVPHPHGDWSSSTYRFEYNDWGELRQPYYSTEQIREFIYEHPRTKHCRLKLWIQRAAADSARRYPTKDSSRCRFRDCPAHVARQNGTILHGHFRVAFDETWHRHRDNVDPFLVAGYVHLYCLERFLDLPDIIRNFDVEVDMRELVNEPRHDFAASLHRKPEGATAQRFVQICRREPETFAAEYASYPDHAAYAATGMKKHHGGTLTALMVATKTQNRSKALANTLAERGHPKSKDSYHLGDLEIFLEASRERRELNRMNRPRRKRRRARKDDSSDEEDEVLDEIVVDSPTVGPSRKKRRA